MRPKKKQVQCSKSKQSLKKNHENWAILPNFAIFAIKKGVGRFAILYYIITTIIYK